jgi:hypothetical protein
MSFEVGSPLAPGPVHGRTRLLGRLLIRLEFLCSGCAERRLRNERMKARLRSLSATRPLDFQLAQAVAFFTGHNLMILPRSPHASPKRYSVALSDSRWFSQNPDQADKSEVAVHRSITYWARLSPHVPFRFEAVLHCLALATNPAFSSAPQQLSIVAERRWGAAPPPNGVDASYQQPQ